MQQRVNSQEDKNPKCKEEGRRQRGGWEGHSDESVYARSGSSVAALGLATAATEQDGIEPRRADARCLHQ